MPSIQKRDRFDRLRQRRPVLSRARLGAKNLNGHRPFSVKVSHSLTSFVQRLITSMNPLSKLSLGGGLATALTTATQTGHRSRPAYEPLVDVRRHETRIRRREMEHSWKTRGLARIDQVAHGSGSSREIELAKRYLRVYESSR